MEIILGIFLPFALMSSGFFLFVNENPWWILLATSSLVIFFFVKSRVKYADIRDRRNGVYMNKR